MNGSLLGLNTAHSGSHLRRRPRHRTAAAPFNEERKSRGGKIPNRSMGSRIANGAWGFAATDN